MGVTQANGISRIEADASPRLQEFFALTKPRVVSLIVSTAVIGMFLATPEIVAFQPLVPVRSASHWWPVPPPPPTVCWNRDSTYCGRRAAA